MRTSKALIAAFATLALASSANGQLFPGIWKLFDDPKQQQQQQDQPQEPQQAVQPQADLQQPDLQQPDNQQQPADIGLRGAYKTNHVRESHYYYHHHYQ